MDTKDKEKKIEKKAWIKPELMVYGDVEKLTKELPIPLPSAPSGGSSSIP